MTAPTTRPMINSDKPAIMEILRNTPEFKPSEVTVAEEVIDCYLKDTSGSGYYVLVTEVASVVIGYVCYGPTPLSESTWDIYWIAVSPEKQRKGIGSLLLTMAESKIREAKGKQAVIETSSKPDYEKTRRFHRSQGYELIGRIPDFYTPGDDKLILLKRL